MSRQAYVLIQTEMGKAEAVSNALRGKPGVMAADVVTGPHDVIAVVQGSDSDSVAKTIINELQAVQGVRTTTTYMVINSGE
ncbi:Lrp/AsnC family transcriptional regulator [Chloroflexota bacterium]